MPGLSAVVCPSCQRPVDTDALFCAGCGAPLRPPTTIELAEPAVIAPVAPSPTTIDNRNVAYVGLASAVVVVVGAFQVWLRIQIADFVPPGGAETGWKGGDGRTIVVAAFVGAVAAAGLLLGRYDLWLKVALLTAGGVTFVIAVVNMVDAGSKAKDIEVQFGIPVGDVHAQIGFGLYLATLGGLGLLAAGLRARTASA